MPKYNKQYINKLEQQLRERFENLVLTMRGQEWHDPYPHSPDEDIKAPEQRLISATEIRLKADDLSTAIREIKASLGKR
jgi:hypothetical protein